MGLNTTNNNNNKNSNLLRGKTSKTLLGVSLGILISIGGVLDQKKAEANEGSISHIPSQSATNKSQNYASLHSKARLYRYTIKSGDTLGKLAKKHGTSIENIMHYNKKISDPGKIFKGKKILIPISVELIEGGSKRVKNLKPKKYKEKKVTKKVKSGPNAIFTKNTINSIITDRDDFTIFYEYGKIYHSKKVNEILISDSQILEKRKKIIELFLTDNKIYGNKTVIKQIQSLKFGNRITKKINDIFSKAGYNINPGEIIELYSKIETSGGNYNYYFHRAKNEKNLEKQDDLIWKAANCAVGPAGDTGPFQITGPWLETEKKYGATINGSYIKNEDVLKRKVYMAFKTAMINGYSIEQTGKVLEKVDVRFNIREMSKIILMSFERLHHKYSKMGSLSEGQIIRLCTLAYNSGEGRANIIANRLVAKKISGKKGLMTKDNRKRSNGIQHASLQNNLKEKKKYAINKVSNGKVITIASISDKVKTHTSKIVDINQRKIVEQKLRHNPIERLKTAQNNPDLKSKGIENIITNLSEYRKAA